MSYVRLPIAAEYQDLVDDFVAQMIESSEGQWEPTRGAVETWLLEAFARGVDRALAIAADMPDAAFTTFGVADVGLQRIAGASARAESTWTIRTAAGHTITAGTLVTLGPDRVLFSVATTVVVPPGETTTAPGEVELVAVVPGSAANLIPPGVARQADTDPEVVSVVTTTTTTGGVEQETDAAYRSRLRDDIRLLSRIPRVPEEFPIVARRIAGVHRARAIRGYDATTDQHDRPRHVTVALADIDGMPVAPSVKDAVIAELTANDRRVCNFIVHVIDPTGQPIDVAFAGIAQPDANPTQVRAAAIAALQTHLSRGGWAGGTLNPPEWWPIDVVRISDLYGVLYSVAGMAHVITGSVTINGGTDDVDLEGVAVLPDATIDGTVIAA